MLERDELAFEREVGHGHPLGVEAPAFDVDGVEGEDGAGVGDAAFDHGRELHLVARAGFVSRKRPGGGCEGEVVVLLGGAGGGRDTQRKDEFAGFAGVADEARRAHVWGGLLGGLGGRGEAHARFAAGEGDEIMGAHDLLEILDAALIVGEDVLAVKLLLLEFADDGAVVRLLPAAGSGDLGSNELHLLLEVAESDAGLGGQGGGGDIDAVLFEAVVVEFDGEFEIDAGLGQDLLTDELLIGGKLLLQGGVRFAVAFDLVAFKELGEAFGECLRVAEMLFDFEAGGGKETGATELRADFAFGVGGEGGVAGFDAGVLAEPGDGGLDRKSVV